MDTIRTASTNQDKTQDLKDTVVTCLAKELKLELRGFTGTTQQKILIQILPLIVWEKNAISHKEIAHSKSENGLQLDAAVSAYNTFHQTYSDFWIPFMNQIGRTNTKMRDDLKKEQEDLVKLYGQL